MINVCYARERERVHWGESAQETDTDLQIKIPICRSTSRAQGYDDQGAEQRRKSDVYITKKKEEAREKSLTGSSLFVIVLEFVLPYLFLTRICYLHIENYE